MIYEIYAAKSSEVGIGYWQECKQCKTLFEAFYQIERMQELGFDVIDLRIRECETGTDGK